VAITELIAACREQSKWRKARQSELNEQTAKLEEQTRDAVRRSRHLLDATEHLVEKSPRRPSTG
jgi:ElaB/YqjD/DUF883 family membrane-anchored ribosome-binding protein